MCVCVCVGVCVCVCTVIYIFFNVCLYLAFPQQQPCSNIPKRQY